MGVLIIKEDGYKISTIRADFTKAILANGYFEKYKLKEKDKNYRLVSNNVDFFWDIINSKNTLIISYKDIVLVKYVEPTNQLVIDYLNEFDNLSKEQIEELVIEAQEVLKTRLELEIETLKEEKVKLLEQVAILKQIVDKKDEIKLLLDKLKD